MAKLPSTPAKPPQGTLIDGIASNELLDSSGERIIIKGMDISSMERGEGVLNWEHESKNASQIVGKIIKAKKIFSEADCEDDRQRHFWQKSQVPYLYIVGELFDHVGHQQAKDVAAMLEYDANARESGAAVKNTINFSIEGQKIEKNGSEITRSIARKTTLTVTPCNKGAIAERVPSAQSLAKSEVEVEIMTKATFPMAPKPAPAPAQPKPAAAAGPQQPAPAGVKLGDTRTGKPVYSHSHPETYKGFTSADHHDAFQLHFNASRAAKENPEVLHHNKLMNWHQLARDRMERRSEGVKNALAQRKQAAVTHMGKALTAGQGDVAPSQKTGGAALVREEAESAFSTWKNKDKFMKFLAKKHPDMSPSEHAAMAKMVAYRQMKKAEAELAKMMPAAPIKKGVNQRLFPFNPQRDTATENTQSIADWQQYGRGGEMPIEDVQDARESTDDMHPNAKKRSLIKLASLTPSRLDQKTGKRHFLLHRGASKEEAAQAAGDTHVSHDTTTSWTPYKNIASNFKDPQYASDELDNEYSKGKVLSAWISEDDISHNPQRYGHVNSVGEVEGKENEYGREGEFIVRPHSSPIARAPRPTKKQAMHSRISQAGPRLAFGGDSDPSAKQQVRQRLTQRYGLEQEKKPKGQKLAASEGAEAENIPGGLASGKSAKDFPRKKLEQGRKVEMEHTRRPTVAREIAMDHLSEDPAYYKKLKTIEKK